MNYLITGGAGYIGSCVSQLLIDKGHKVIIIDNNTYKTIYINFKRKQPYMIIKNSNKPLLNKYMKRDFFKLILHH